MIPYAMPDSGGATITVSSSALTLSEFINAAATGSFSTPPGTVDECYLIPETNDIRITFDNNDPTASDGLLLKGDTMYHFVGIPVNKIKLIRVGGVDVTVDVQVGYSDGHSGT